MAWHSCTDLLSQGPSTCIDAVENCQLNMASKKVIIVLFIKFSKPLSFPSKLSEPNIYILCHNLAIFLSQIVICLSVCIWHKQNEKNFKPQLAHK